MTKSLSSHEAGPAAGVPWGDKVALGVACLGTLLIFVLALINLVGMFLPP